MPDFFYLERGGFQEKNIGRSEFQEMNIDPKFIKPSLNRLTKRLDPLFGYAEQTNYCRPEFNEK